MNVYLVTAQRWNGAIKITELKAYALDHIEATTQYLGGPNN